jgi:type VII secretion integral membrane protein EccD
MTSATELTAAGGAGATPPTGSGLVRVTVVAGTRRADLALPAALPVAELVPELTRTLGVLDARTAYAGYDLVTAEGRRLTGDAGLTYQGVEDGAVLTVSAGVDEEPPRVYDDVVEAMADAVEGDLQPWDPASGRRTALGSGALLLGLGALALALRRPDVVAGAAAGIGALVLVTSAVVLARVRAEHAAALTLAWAGVLFAFVCGLTAAPTGDLLALPTALGGVGAMLAGVVGVLGLRDGRALLLPAVVVGAVVAGASALVTATDLSAAGVYTVALVLAVLVGSALPWFALGSTSTRVDQPHSDADLTADPEEVSPTRVVHDARSAHEILLGVTATVGLLLVLVAPLAVGLGVTGTLVAVCAALVLLLRTRQYRVGSEVATGLVCGVAGLVAVAVSVLVEHPGWHVTLALVLAVTAAVLLVSTLVPLAPSVRRGRLGDVAELVALVALLPLLVLAIGLVGAVRV